MTPLPRLHWSTLGEPTRELEHRWAGVWQVTVDRGPAPALPPRDTDLWVISAAAADPGPALARLAAEVGALPILVLVDPGAARFDPAALSNWGALGSRALGPAQGRAAPARPAPRSRRPRRRLSVSQALGLGLVGIGAAMRDVLGKARAASATRATVLLLGESGTGKEIIAQAIHRMSAAARPALRPGALRRHPRQPDRIRAVRLHQGRLHRRPQGRPRQVPGGPRRAPSSWTR